MPYGVEPGVNNKEIMGYTPINIRETTNTSGEYVFPIGAFNKARQLVAQLAVTEAASTGSPKLDVAILQSYDGGVTYDEDNPLIEFTQITTSEDVEVVTDGGNPFSGDLKAVFNVTGGAAHGVLTVDPAGANNKYTVTGKQTIPSDDNVTSLTIVEGAAGASIAVAVDGTDITVTLAKSAGTTAVLSTALAGNHNDLDYRARAGVGVAGNSITIAYIDPPGNNVPLSVAVSGTAITVTLATNGSSTITSTAQKVMNAIGASPEAAALVGVNLKAGNDGTGVVTALVATNLATGAAPAVTSTTGNVITAVAANVAANALVGITNFAANDGTGLSAALAKTYLDSFAGETYSYVLSGFGK